MKNKRIPLPEELRAYVARRVIMRVGACVILLLATAYVLIRWGESIFVTDVVEFRICCYVMVMIVPPLLMGIPLKLIDHAYSGEIVDVDVDAVTAVENTTAKGHLVNANVVSLTILTDDEELMVEELSPSKRKVEHLEAEYHSGDKVWKFYGLPKLLVVPEKDNGRVNCLVCGCDNKSTDKKCFSCGHALVDISRYRKS